MLSHAPHTIPANTQDNIHLGTSSSRLSPEHGGTHSENGGSGKIPLDVRTLPSVEKRGCAILRVTTLGGYTRTVYKLISKPSGSYIYGHPKWYTAGGRRNKSNVLKQLTSSNSSSCCC